MSAAVITLLSFVLIVVALLLIGMDDKRSIRRTLNDSKEFRDSS